MINSPRRQRVMNFHKQFQRSRGALTSRTESKNSIESRGRSNVQFSFNAELRKKQFDFECSRQSVPKRNLCTINPEDKNKRSIFQNKQEIPLKNNHFYRRKQFINPKLLLSPLIEDVTHKQLKQRDEEQPDSMNKMLSESICFQNQKPLDKQHASITRPNQQQMSISTAQLIEKNHRAFIEKYKHHQIYLNSKKAKLPNLAKNESKQGQNFQKLLKQKSDMFSNTNLYYRTKKQKQEQNQGRLQIQSQFKHLLSDNNVDKVKSTINKIVSQKSKSKPKIKINDPNQSLIESPQSQDQFKTIRSQAVCRQTIKQSDYIYGYNPSDYNYNSKQTKKRKPFSFSLPKSLPKNKNDSIVISYKTSLSQLKHIYKKLYQVSHCNVQIVVPKILMQDNFGGIVDEREMHDKARLIYDSLAIQIQSGSFSVKKYSNCVLMAANIICIICYNSGKVYLGGWQFKNSDQGCKQGMGLQWVPNQYVYYGQYQESKKHGLGVVKTKQQVSIGQWVGGKKSDNDIVIDKKGQVFHPRLSFESRVEQNYEDNPFL